MISLICAATIWVNMTTFPWNDNDKKAYNRAVYVCSSDEQYSETPCLARFVKKGERDYNAFCGEAKDG
jgi:hypothetical protein